jgi:dihydroorotase
MKLLIKNGMLVSGGLAPEKKDILLANDMVEKVGDDIPSGDASETLDASGCYVVPGLIDICTEIYSLGYERRENILSASKSAAKGGYTSLASQCSIGHTDNSRTHTNYVLTKSRGQSLVNVFPCGSMATGDGRISEIGEMLDEGIIAVSDGGTSIDDAGLMLNILDYARMFDIPVIVTCADQRLMSDGQINKGRVSTMLGLKGIPREAEEIMVARNLLLARGHNPRMHIANISTKGSVELVRSHKKAGMNVTCGTNPHYFTLTEDVLETYDTFAKVKPPLRTREDLEHIIEGIADGTIDVISSGHSPATIDSKLQEFDRAAYGISSLETSFPISYTALVESGHISFARLIECMSQNPAKILGLKRKGIIEPGSDADLCVISVDSRYKIDGAQFASLAKFTPYQGHEVLGEVVHTMVNGQVVYIK